MTSFVEDAITELEQRNARDVVEYLRMMLECDGPDVDGAVSSLVKYGAVTVAWVGWWSSGGTCRTRAGSRSPFVGGYGSVRRIHFRSYTSRIRKPCINVVKSMNS